MSTDRAIQPEGTNRRIELIAGSGCYVSLTSKPRRKHSLLPRWWR
jgi:hypothetical protein